MKVKPLLYLLVFFTVIWAPGQYSGKISGNNTDSLIKKCEAYYEANKGNEIPSISAGTHGNGKLINGKLMPFKGANFRFFDYNRYLSGKAFVNNRLKSTLLSSYGILDSLIPGKVFYFMECSEQNGGKFFPHNTHQNGLSVDFMMSMIKDAKTYTALDSLGFSHYLLTLDNQGKYSEDSSISIDFELAARHILLLEKEARKNGLRVSKVIIKIELKDELFTGKYGHLLRKSGIYVVKGLTPMLNEMHDEHYHVDFELIKKK